MSEMSTKNKKSEWLRDAGALVCVVRVSMQVRGHHLVSPVTMV